MKEYRITFKYGFTLGVQYIYTSFEAKEDALKALAYSYLCDAYSGLTYNDIIRVELINGGSR